MDHARKAEALGLIGGQISPKAISAPENAKTADPGVSPASKHANHSVPPRRYPFVEFGRARAVGR